MSRYVYGTFAYDLESAIGDFAPEHGLTPAQVAVEVAKVLAGLVEDATKEQTLMEEAERRVRDKIIEQLKGGE